MTNATHPTPYPAVNAVLLELLAGAQSILGPHLIGLYLEGSLATGDFDDDSDIDFVAVTDAELSSAAFAALRTMHEDIATMDSGWAIQLEGSYISQHALRRHDPTQTLYPNIQRGKGERLKLVHHDEAWVIHRSVLRDRGITLVGPAPQMLIDHVSPDDLRGAMLFLLREWATPMLDDPTQIKYRGYQSYTVLSLCRMLYTLHCGTVASKAVAARWAQQVLGARWVPLIERTWAGRHNPEWEASSEDINGTLEFIRYTLERSQPFQKPTEVA